MQAYFTETGEPCDLPQGLIGPDGKEDYVLGCLAPNVPGKDGKVEVSVFHGTAARYARVYGLTVLDEPLGRGERLVNGERLYSAAWL